MRNVLRYNALTCFTDTQSMQHGSDERRRSQHDYESVKSDDLQSIQPSPEIEMNQSSTIDKTTPEAEMDTVFAESKVEYSILCDRPVVQEPQPYSSLEITNSDEQWTQRSVTQTSANYCNVEIQLTDAGKQTTQIDRGQKRLHDYCNVNIGVEIHD